MAGTTQTSPGAPARLDARFLRLAFSSLAIPPAVLPQVLDVYLPRFAFTFAHNMRLGAGVDALVTHLVKDDDPDDLVSFIRTNNPYALDVLLATSESRDRVVKAVLETWVLSSRDQLRLVDRELSTDLFERVLRATDLFTPARVVAACRLEEPLDFIDALARFPTSGPLPSHSYPRNALPADPEGYSFESDPSERAGEGATVAGLATLHSLWLISDYLNTRLGDGTDQISLLAWMNFLGLCQNDPYVEISSVVTSAKSLARAELAVRPSPTTSELVSP